MIGEPNLVLPKRFGAKRAAVIRWFRRVDEKLVAFVEAGEVRAQAAQGYFFWKVKHDEHLDNDSKERLLNEGKIFKLLHADKID